MVFAPLFLIGLRHMYNSVCSMIGLEVAALVVHPFNVAIRGAARFGPWTHLFSFDTWSASASLRRLYADLPVLPF